MLYQNIFNEIKFKNEMVTDEPREVQLGGTQRAVSEAEAVRSTIPVIGRGKTFGGFWTRKS